MKRYYVYDLIDPRTNQPFYVGKGQGNRIYSHVSAVLNHNQDDNLEKCNRIREIIKEGLDVGHTFVDWFDVEKDALAFEKKRIEHLGRISDGGVLCNCKTGGPETQAGRTKPIKRCDYCTGEVLQIYSSTMEAVHQMNIKHKSSLANAVIGRCVSYMGFIWCYADESPRIPTTLIYEWTQFGQLISIHKNEGDASRAIGCAQAQLHNCLISGRPCKGNVVSRTATFPGITPKKPAVPPPHELRCKSVVHINTQRIYPSVTAAAKATGHNIGKVSSCCLGTIDGIGKHSKHTELDYFKYLE